MLTILIAKENNNIYHDASHASASIIFRLGSGAARRSTTMAKTPNYLARLWLLPTMAKFCSGTHVPDHSAAADGFLTKPTTAAVRGNTHEVPTTPNLQKQVPTPDLHYVHIIQWPKANTARTWACLGLLCAVMWPLMMDHGNIGGFQTGPRWHPDGRTSFRQWMRTLSAWLNVTSSRMSPTAQAAAIQLGLQGMAREVAMRIPPAAITHGAVINGVNVCL